MFLLVILSASEKPEAVRDRVSGGSRGGLLVVIVVTGWPRFAVPWRWLLLAVQFSPYIIFMSLIA